MLLTRFIKMQLVLFTVLTVIALVVLALIYLRLPTWAGVGMYNLNANLPNSGGLYATANVTYRGTTIGKVTSVEPTEQGARVEMNIYDRYRVPLDASANVHSVSAVGEQFIDLVSKGGYRGVLPRRRHHREGHACPPRWARRCDAAQQGLAALPKEKIAVLLDETAHGRRRPRPVTAAPGRLDPGDRRRLQGQPRFGQRHRRELRADHRQPGQLGRRHLAVGQEPEHAGGAERPERRGAAQRHPAGGADGGSAELGVR